MEFGNSGGSRKPTQGASEPRSPGSATIPKSQSPKTPTVAGGAVMEKMQEANSPLRMQDARSVCSPGANPVAITPFILLVQGAQQTIKIPLKTILMKAMQTMPAKKAPLFKCVHAGPSGYQVCVQLDVTGSRVTVEPSTTVAKVIGDVCGSTTESVESAALKAFEYLESKHFTRLIDYSSSVVEQYDDMGTWTDVNACSYVTEKVLAEWSMSIDSIRNFLSELERKEAAENVYGTRTQAGERYGEAKNFVACLVTKYAAKHRALDLDFRGFEGQRSSYLKQCNDETNAMLMKGYKQTVRFTEKDVLDYVLKFLGLKEAEYNNKPLVESGLFRGEVEIWLPEIEEAHCGGRTKFKGINLLTAAAAEEDAAAKALRYLESKLKITVVDKNYDERVRAKEKHNLLMKLLRNILHTVEQIKIEWSRMVSYMDDGVAIFGDTLQPFSERIPADAEVAAVNFCTEGIAAAHANCVSAYEAGAAKIKGLEKYYPSPENFDE